MGRNDVVMKQWLSDKERFADFVNGSLFQGKQVLSAENLKKEEREQSIIIQNKGEKEIVVQRYRDIAMLSEEGTRVVIVACESQDEIHYAMPVRGMLYDALSYAEQIREIRKQYNRQNALKESAEFLSGLKKTDFLVPVITIVFYYGSREEWDGKEELHGLLGLGREEYWFLKKYVPNYKINLIDPRKLEDLECFQTDLKLIFGMLKYRDDKKEMLKYVKKNQKYFSQIDEDSYNAARVMLGSERSLKPVGAWKKNQETGGIDMCKALDDLYQEGVQKGLNEGRSLGLSEGRSLGLSEGRSLGLREGRNLGLSEGIGRGIEAMILDYQEEGFSREKIVAKLIKRFSLTMESAQACYEKFSAAA